MKTERERTRERERERYTKGIVDGSGHFPETLDRVASVCSHGRRA